MKFLCILASRPPTPAATASPGSHDLAPRAPQWPAGTPWRHSHAKIVPPRPHLHAVAVTGGRSHQRPLGKARPDPFGAVKLTANPADTTDFDHHAAHTAHGGGLTDADFFFFTGGKNPPRMGKFAFFLFFCAFWFLSEKSPDSASVKFFSWSFCELKNSGFSSRVKACKAAANP